MIVQKSWNTKNKKFGPAQPRQFVYTGWFLFGIIPIYIKRVGIYYLAK